MNNEEACSEFEASFAARDKTYDKNDIEKVIIAGLVRNVLHTN